QSPSSGLPLPPGPPSDSIFATSFESQLFHQHFEQWTQEYGPVFSFRQGLKTIIIVGRFQAAMDIMEKEGASLADCPRSIAAGETLSGGMRVLLTSASERFKKMQSQRALLVTPNTHYNCETEYAGHCPGSREVRAAVVMDSAYSKLSPSYKDPKIRFVNRCLIRCRLTMHAGA
ncbi:hypothetical protein IW261DRAFT_1628586, partial [Armillaria novae-zelandiae]